MQTNFTDNRTKVYTAGEKMIIRLFKAITGITLITVIMALSCSDNNGPSRNEDENVFIKYFTISPDEDFYIGSQERKIFRSPDRGNIWRFVCQGPEDFALQYIAVAQNGYILIGNSYYNPMVTPNKGHTWEQYTTGLEYSYITGLVIGYDGSVYVSTNDEEVIYSTNGGTSWTFLNNENITSGNISWLSISPNNNYFAYIQYRTIFLTSGDFKNWTELQYDSANGLMKIIALDDDGGIYIGTYTKGLFYSSDNGETWNQIEHESMNEGISSITVDKNGNIYVVPSNGKLFRSNDKGTTWEELIVEPL